MPVFKTEFPSRAGAGWRAGDDPLVVAETVAFVNNTLKDATIPLRAARSTLISDVEMRFDTQTDPEGHPWTPWKESYAPRGERENKGILEKTSKLRDAAVQEDSYNISTKMTGLSGGSIALVGSNLPDYWEWHQEGTANMPARPIFGVSEQAEMVINETFDLYYSNIFLNLTKHGVPIFRVPRGASFVPRDVFNVR